MQLAFNSGSSHFKLIFSTVEYAQRWAPQRFKSPPIANLSRFKTLILYITINDMCQSANRLSLLDQLTEGGFRPGFSSTVRVYLKEPVFSIFLQKFVRHRSLTQPIEIFLFWLRIGRDFRNPKWTPSYQRHTQSPTPCQCQ